MGKIGKAINLITNKKITIIHLSQIACSRALTKRRPFYYDEKKERFILAYCEMGWD